VNGDNVKGPSNVTVTESRRRRILTTLTRWGFPFVGLATTLATQIALPSILQRRLSVGEYTSYVAVTSLAAYLGLSDGGLLNSVIRELSALHGAGDRARYAGEVRRTRNVYVVVPLLGCAIAAIGMASTLGAAEAVWGGAASVSFRMSVVEVVATTAILMGTGSFHTAIQFSSGRLLGAQVVGLVNSVTPLVVLVSALLVTRDLAWGLHCFAGSQLVFGVWRAWGAHRLVRIECGDVTPTPPPSPLLHLLTAGLTFKAADVLPGSAYPNQLSVRAPTLVPTAVPARTYANACRLVPNLFLSLLQVHITRRLAGSDAERARGEREYRESANILCAMHLCAVAVVAALAVPVFRLWLPTSAATVTSFLPGLLVEQTLAAAALPCIALLIAKGWLRSLGSVRLTGAVLGLGVFVLSLHVVREAAYGVGFAAAAVPLFVFGAWVELRPPKGFPEPDLGTFARYGLALAAGAACSMYAQRPILASAAVTCCALGLVPLSARGMWRLIREMRGAPHQDANGNA
jgi:hypothetical protein